MRQRGWDAAWRAEVGALQLLLAQVDRTQRQGMAKGVPRCSHLGVIKF